MGFGNHNADSPQTVPIMNSWMIVQSVTVQALKKLEQVGNTEASAPQTCLLILVIRMIMFVQRRMIVKDTYVMHSVV